VAVIDSINFAYNLYCTPLMHRHTSGLSHFFVHIWAIITRQVIELKSCSNTLKCGKSCITHHIITRQLITDIWPLDSQSRRQWKTPIFNPLSISSLDRRIRTNLITQHLTLRNPRVLGSGFQIQDFRFRMSGLEFQVQGFMFRDSGLGFQV